MTATEHTVMLFLGVGVLLLIASAIGFILHRRARARGVVSPTVENLNARRFYEVEALRGGLCRTGIGNGECHPVGTRARPDERVEGG